MIALLAAFTPHSPGAEATFDLGILSTIIFTLIFVAVGGTIIYSLLRYRWREGEPEPKQIAGQKTVELVWTAIPLAIVIFLFILTARTMSKVDPAPPAQPDLVITGHQFWWEARYTGSGAVVAHEIHIPVGKPYSVRLESADVVHELWVAGISRKIEAIPGRANYLWLEASKPGTYTGVCTEFCGVQHAWMRFRVVAEDEARFSAWEQAQSRPALMPTDPVAMQGLTLFREMSCVNCHAIKGIFGATGGVAPDLTHLASRTILAGGVSENTPENLRLWLADPQQMKPGALMPNYHFTPEQMTQLMSYFETLR
jgi:cytochrome c oxidase subunit 2